MSQRMQFERVYIAAVEQANAIRATKCKEINQTEMAVFYADCLYANEYARQNDCPQVDFVAVNNAIRKRWPKGLLRIKTKAWKILGL